jgi:hypothetical protein
MLRVARCSDGVEIPVYPASSIAETLTDSGLVGDGTFGAVYLLESAANLVVKVFKPACDEETRLHEIMCLGCVCVARHVSFHDIMCLGCVWQF